MTTHWTAGLHHDGSALYVSNPYPALNETVTLTLRAPLDAPITAVFIRSEPDGEIHMEPMTITDNDSVSAYWTASLRVSMPRVMYRFKILSGEGAYYLNQRWVSRAESPDWQDFKLLADYSAPLWVRDAIFYQIFPDRFHNGDPSLTVKPGAWRKRNHEVQVVDWDTLPRPFAESGSLDFYGGDLPGIIAKLDYLQDLGVTALYLNPIFPSSSNHRYNIDDFHHVDPHLGGDDALVALREALDERGMRIVLDTTPNHSAETHTWFQAALADENAPTASYYTIYKRPDEYEMWLGVRTLPKLNYASPALRDAMYRAPDSVLRHWLKPPFRIDGWRLDVLNMTARQGADQLQREVGQEMREAVKDENPDCYLMGEHFFDATTHLQGDELDAVMNYAGFNIPLWRWVAGYDGAGAAEARDNTLLPSQYFAETLANFRAALPYVIALQQFNQLGSHDTHRILSICGEDKALAKLAFAILVTAVGVPCVYYGDEIGLTGERDPLNRRTMPWDDEGKDETRWDSDMRAFYKQIIGVRQAHEALRTGGYQQLAATDGFFAFQRHALEETLIVAAYRGADDGGDAPLTDAVLPVRAAGTADGVMLTDVMSGATFTVADGAVSLGTMTKGAFFILQVS